MCLGSGNESAAVGVSLAGNFIFPVANDNYCGKVPCKYDVIKASKFRLSIHSFFHSKEKLGVGRRRVVWLPKKNLFNNCITID